LSIKNLTDGELVLAKIKRGSPRVEVFDGLLRGVAQRGDHGLKVRKPNHLAQLRDVLDARSAPKGEGHHGSIQPFFSK
jgi:hypothetical protein